MWRAASEPQLQFKSESFNFVKKVTLTQLFSCEFSKIFNNNFLKKTPPVAASGNEIAKVLSLRSENDFFNS